MTIIGKKAIKEQIIPAREVDEKSCDYPISLTNFPSSTYPCKADATNAFPCQKCQRDLCARHQIDVHRIVSGHKEIYGIYCKECLIAEINARFKETNNVF